MWMCLASLRYEGIVCSSGLDVKFLFSLGLTHFLLQSSDKGISGLKILKLPLIEGTRISVEQVLGLLAKGMTNEDIIESYPILSEESIRAVLGYAARALQNDIVVDAPSRREGVS